MSFVEVVGTKAAGEVLVATSLVKFPSSQVDEGLWNDAVNLAQMKQLRELFAPLGGLPPSGVLPGTGDFSAASAQPASSQAEAVSVTQTQGLTSQQRRGNAALSCAPTQLDSE